MKNFALLLSSLAVASVAVAASPEVSKHVGTVSNTPLETVQMEAKSVMSGMVLSDKSAAVKAFDMKKSPMKVEGFSVSYQEPAGIFALGISEDLRGYQNFIGRKGPAYTPLTWTNTSVGATEFEWEVIKDFETSETQTFQTVDFEHAETYSLVDAPILYGMDAEGNTGVYQFSAEAISDTELSEPTVSYFFGGSCAPGNLNVGMTTYMYEQNQTEEIGYTTFSSMTYNTKEKQYYNPETGLVYIFTDPDDEENGGYGMIDPKFKGFANVFGTPAAPYLISKMWGWYNFIATKASNVELVLYKIDEEGYITDEVLAAGETSVEASRKAQSTMLIFDLYALDEDGLQTDDPIIIDCPFVAVMTFNAADFDEISPVCGGGATMSVEDPISYPSHAYIVIENDGEEGYYRSPYRYFTDESRTTLMAVTDFLWMVDAVFPWSTVIDDATTVEVPAEGGFASFNINSYYSIQYYGFAFPEDCDWIDLEASTIEENEELGCETLNLAVAALPEDVKGRSVEIDVDAITTSYTLTVTQGEDTGVSVVATEKGAQYFDLQGRRVANPEKGIYIKKSGNKTEKVIL